MGSDWLLEQVISGGQTGADEAGLRAAKVLGYQTGGMMPRGWKTEAGPRPEFRELYNMVESRFEGYEHRTRHNVRVADGTVIFARTDSSGWIREHGSNLTETTCRACHKPCLVIDFDWWGNADALHLIRGWIRAHKIRLLNGAGNRESVRPGIGAAVESFLVEALQRC